ncbi:metal ABC transporter substrate-binding protein, partial [Streptococcus minor]
MFKKIALGLSVILTFVLLGACQSQSPKDANSTEKPVVTVTTSFLYDMVYQLAGDEVDRQLLIPAGEDPHLYVAKSSDLKKLQEADLVLYHGLHFEGKMVDALEKTGVAVSKDFKESDIGK